MRLLHLHLPAAAAAAAVSWLAVAGGGVAARSWLPLAAGAVPLALWLVVRHRLPELRGPLGLSILAGAALSVWTLASAAWADAPRLALVEGGRTSLYTAVAVLGVAVGLQAGGAARLAAWLGAAAAALGIVTCGRLVLAGGGPGVLNGGRLDEPFGYANAAAAFFAIGTWLLVGISCAADRRQLAATQPWVHEDWQRRMLRTGMLTQPPLQARGLVLDAAASGAALGGATLLACLLVLTQSRGALVAAVVSLIVAYVAIPGRLGLTLRLATIAALVGASYGSLTGAYAVAERAAPGAAGVGGGELAATPAQAVEAAVRAAAIATTLAALLGALLLLFAGVRARRRAVALERAAGAGGASHWPGDVSTAKKPTGGRWLALAAAGGLLAASAAALPLLERSPVEWAREHVQACRELRDTSRTAGARSRFAEVGSNRCDFWRVAIAVGRDEPVRGIGAGNFGDAYLDDARSPETPAQVHSLPLALWAELGGVGVLLGLGLLAGVALGAHRWIAQGGARNPATGAVVAAAAGWLVHAGVDWLWQFTAVTAPLALLLGALLGSGAVRRRRSEPPARPPA